ncbi:MAG: carbohydrate kinase family protein, partial [Spirochaetota bacterium]
MEASSAMSQKVLLLGGVILDHYIVASFPQKGEDTLIVKEFDRVAGCALNVAVTLRNLGKNPYIVSSIGNDLRGKTILAYLKKRRIDLKFIEQYASSEPIFSGYSMVVLDPDGERTFFTYRGCEGRLPQILRPERKNDSSIRTTKGDIGT